MIGLSEIDLEESELHVPVDVVAVDVVRGRDNVAAAIRVGGLDHIDVLQLRLDLGLPVAPQRDHHVGIGVRGQIVLVPGDADLGGVLLVHIIGGEEDLLGGGSRGLHEVLSAPLEPLGSHGDLESDIALGLQVGLHTDYAVPIHIGSQHGLRIEVARHPDGRIKAGSSDIDDLTTQHITRLGGKGKR